MGNRPDYPRSRSGQLGRNNPNPPSQPTYIYFARYDSSYTTASYANSVFSSAPYQTPQQTAAMLPDLVTFANAEAAGTAADVATTDATGNTTYVNPAGGTTYLIFVHGKRDPHTCPYPLPISTDPSKFFDEQYGTWDNDQCNLWAYKPGTGAKQLLVQWDSWYRYFDNPHPRGGNFRVRDTILKHCQHPNICHIICHSAGCAATENVLARLHAQGLTTNTRLMLLTS